MAQGKLKVKANKPANVKKGQKGAAKSGKVNKQYKVAHRGNMVIAPKKAKQREAFNITKSMSKSINANIERELAGRAIQSEEGKKFNFIKADAAAAGKGKKKQ